MRAAWSIAASFLLSGCVPPVVSVASYVADGGLYVATGKTMSDHGMTAATGHDCSIIRNFKAEGPICLDEIAQRPDPAPVDRGARGLRPQLHFQPRDRYVALGSFANLDNAKRMVKLFGEFASTVTPVEVGGKQYHRVVAGPLNADEASLVKARLAERST